MHLSAHWINASVSYNQRMIAEHDLEEYLIDHFGGATAAFNCKVSFNSCNRPPNHPWNIGLNKGIDLATRDLSPSACYAMKWEIKFYDD